MKYLNMMSARRRWAALGILFGALLAASSSFAQESTFGSEDFTTSATVNSWYYFGGACLTAGTATPSANPGQIPGCTALLASYYNLAANADPFMMGGYNGYLGSSTAPAGIAAQVPDPTITNPDGSVTGLGALRFTNGSINVTNATTGVTTHSYGHNERGAILSSSTYPTGSGFQVTFKTVTYHGDSGGAGTDGADGISFFLQDGSQPAGLGAWGGSLAYSCSNSNTPHDGLIGAYIGLGIDEYGNFLNGTNLVAGYTGTNVATGDNAAYGYGYKPGRIGLRGAGNVSWPSLTAAYGANPSNPASPYYPSSLATSCTNAGGVYSATTGNCTQICSTAGSYYDSTTGVCNKACPTNATYDAALNTCNSCASVNGTYDPTTTTCTNTNKCATGTTYYAGTGACNACPAAGYATGTYNSTTGMCTNSCPTGYTLTGTTCYPTGSVYSSGYYCPSGSTIANNSGSYVCYTSGLSYLAGFYCPSGSTIALNAGVYGCYPTGNSYSVGYYCPSGSTITAYSGAEVCYPSSGVTYASGYYCPTGQTLNGAYCYTTGLSHSGNYYCPSGQTISGTSCYPTGDSQSAGYYCPSGQTISGTSCYPTGDSQSAGYYCPSGQTISGTHCYPTGDSISGTNYCPSGQTISGTSCYPNGLSHSGTNYCPSGQTISGTSCYPTGDVYSSPYYCPSGYVVASAHCCPTGNTYNAGTGKCSGGTSPVAIGTATAATAMTTATAMPAATAESAATPMSAAPLMGAATAASAAIATSAASAAGPATAVAAAQAVTPVQTATQNTTPTETPPSTYAAGTGNVDAQYAVQNTCKTGNLYNYSSASAPTSAGTATLDNTVNTAGILDYPPIPNAFTELTSFQIANEGAITRGAATPIFYNLKITQNGLLSLSYSVSGGAYSYLIKDQSITASNGPLPASFRVGFAGSDGGASNIHEIMCFKASTYKQSGSSATANDKQSAKVQAGSQAYFAYYDPNDWTGTVTANTLVDTAGTVTVSTTANWDASCVLNGTAASGGCVNTGAGGPTSATPAPANRIMLTWDTVNNVGIPFEWGSLNAAQQAALDFGDTAATSTRLSYLRGDRSNEINSSGVGLYRARDTIVGDVVDSSPVWVGAPSSPYTASWRDRIYGTAMPENTGTQSYLQYTAAQQTRLNVVYVGANDGFLHGFRAGSFSSTGTFIANGSTPNDGQEVLAYMPGSMLASAALGSAAGGCTNSSTTQTLVQGIHGVTPAVGGNAECTAPLLDYANTQYGHNFFVDATPGTGDIFYGGTWHTWLVGGLGAGGQAIYALDVTNPVASNLTEGNASSIVIGEWNSGSITCANVPNCGNSLGNTFGTPQIRRLHNGKWGVIFGNGFGSATGDAGIYVMSIDPSTGAQTFYYLTTGTSGANGIAYVTPADLDGDHITDYVYAGDLYGNVWRFDLTSNNPASWGVQGTPLFTTQFQSASLTTDADTPSGNVLLFAAVTGVSAGQAVSGANIAAGTYVQSVVGATVVLSQNVSGDVPSGTTLTFSGNQPITSQLVLVSTTITGGAPRILLEFGTGERTQLTNLAPVQYASGVQSLYGVWDWNLSNWNSLAPGAAHQSLALTTAATGLASPYTLSYANLAAQTLTANANGTVDGTNVPVCWQGSTTCTATNNQFGWYANLPSSGEQIIYNGVFNQGAFEINSTVPANNLATSCTSNSDTGYSYALAVINGGVFTNTFPSYSTPTGTTIVDSMEAGVQTNATGSVYNVTTTEGTSYMVYQTIPGVPGTQKVSIPSNTKSKRLTWIEQR
jgi:type IV pilus assembly protein PilY1